MRKPSKKVLNQAAVALGQARWAGVSAEDRSKALKAARAHGGGKPRLEDRCYCGKHSWHSATIRRFDCCKKAGKYPSGKPEPKGKS